MPDLPIVRQWHVPSRGETVRCPERPRPWARPGLAVPSELQWVSLTGHWADPASSSCRHLPDRRFPSSAGTAELAFRCRLVFVATSLEPAAAP